MVMTAGAAAIGALGGLLSSGAGFLSANYSSAKALKNSLILQANQNAWMERMANTSHQREVEDLKKAGLNPILSATGGSGSAVPSAGSGTQSPVDPQLAQGIATALDFKRLRNETELKDSTKDVNASSVKMNDSLGRKYEYEADSAHEYSVNLNEQTRQLQQYGPVLKELEALKLQNDIRNSNLTTASQVNLNEAQAWRARHQALGFSESESKNDSYQPFEDVNWSLKAGKFGTFGIGKSGTKYVKNYSRSRTY